MVDRSLTRPAEPPSGTSGSPGLPAVPAPAAPATADGPDAVAPADAVGGAEESGSDAARLPVPTGLGRGLVLASVFVCAACGLVYELELVALASYLVGDSVTQASLVLSSMVFAMGLGSLLAKRLRCRAAGGFGAVEGLLALVGGTSAMALHAFFAWFGAARVPLVGFSLAIGVLTGAEMPLLMTLIQRIRRQDAGGAVADLFAADYVGALVGGLLFPFLLLPFFGQLTGALLTGVVNASAGGVVVLWLFRRDVSRRVRWWLLAVNAGIIALLLAGTAVVAPFERAARHAMYGPDVRVAVRSDLQEMVLTGARDPAAARGHGGQPTGFYLDGRLRACSADPPRYDTSLVRPALSGGPHGRVLVLGGGDGLALRQVLRRPGVRSVTVVELDPELLRLARTDPGLRRLNGDAYRDPRVRRRAGDAFRWLRGHVARTERREGREQRAREAPSGGPARGGYDAIVVDLPDPSDSESSKLYSQEFYGLAKRSLAPGGRLVVHAGSGVASGGAAGGAGGAGGAPESGDRRRDFWTVDASLRAAGLRPAPYVVGSGPSGCTADRDRGRGGARSDGRGGARDWGFVLATSPRSPSPPSSRVSASPSDGWFRAARARAEHDRISGLPASTLMRPRY